MAFVKDKDGNTKQVTDFVANNNQLLKKYGYTAVTPATSKPEPVTETVKKKAAKAAVRKGK